MTVRQALVPVTGFQEMFIFHHSSTCLKYMSILFGGWQSLLQVWDGFMAIRLGRERREREVELAMK